MTGVRLTRRAQNGRRQPALRLPSVLERLAIDPREVPDKRYDQIERTLMPGRDLRASQGSAREMQARSVADRPAIARRGRRILYEDDLGRVRRSVMGEARHQSLVVQHSRYALRGHRKIGYGFDSAEHHAEFFALDRAGFEMHLHSRLDLLALFGGDKNHGLELVAFALDADDRRTDGKHRAG